jgi:hypothetical protein
MHAGTDASADATADLHMHGQQVRGELDRDGDRLQRG